MRWRATCVWRNTRHVRSLDRWSDQLLQGRAKSTLRPPASLRPNGMVMKHKDWGAGHFLLGLSHSYLLGGVPNVDTEINKMLTIH
jgi:hypothetical protein